MGGIGKVMEERVDAKDHDKFVDERADANDHEEFEGGIGKRSINERVKNKLASDTRDEDIMERGSERVRCRVRFRVARHEIEGVRRATVRRGGVNVH